MDEGRGYMIAIIQYLVGISARGGHQSFKRHWTMVAMGLQVYTKGAALKHRGFAHVMVTSQRP